jgi:CheY-like chemotaxis protein
MERTKAVTGYIDGLRKSKFTNGQDFRMTFPDGLELTRQMRESGFNKMTPVVLISDDPYLHAMAQGFEAGASFFLYTPIDKDRRLRLVRATQCAIEHERRRTRQVPLRSKVQLRIGGGNRGRNRGSQHGRVAGRSATGCSDRVFGRCALALVERDEAREGAGCVVRLPATNQMGIHQGRLVPAESQRLQEFLLSIVPVPTQWANNGLRLLIECRWGRSPSGSRGCRGSNAARREKG